MLSLLTGIAATGLVVAAVSRVAMRRQCDDFAALTPAAFERAIGAWLARDGWLVEHRGGSGDQGIDLLAFLGRDVVVLQCKRYGPSAAVTPAQLRELYGAAHAVGATTAVMVTTGRISRAGQSWAAKLPANGPALLIRDGAALSAMNQRRERLLA